MLRTVAFAFAAASLVAVVPAMAQDVETHTTLVRYGDLDLANQAGQQSLQHRVDAALNKVCGLPTVGDSDGIRANQLCRIKARKMAQPQVTLAIANAGGDQHLAAR